MKHTNSPEVDAAYAAAHQILLDCRCPNRTSEIKLGGGRGTIFTCCECWNRHVYARRDARKLQLAQHNARLAPCEGPHAKPTPGRWELAGAHLCGRCKTKAKAALEKKAAQSGAPFLFMFSGGARFSREDVLDALRKSA